MAENILINAHSWFINFFYIKYPLNLGECKSDVPLTFFCMLQSTTEANAWNYDDHQTGPAHSSRYGEEHLFAGERICHVTIITVVYNLSFFIATWKYRKLYV